MNIQQKAKELFAELDAMELDDRVKAINSIKKALHEHSPFKDEPVDCVIWVPSERVQANDYNPNSVAPPEMELLAHSIREDGYTQPIVSWTHDDGTHEVVDGFHRNRVGRENMEVNSRIKGYLPLVVINKDRLDRSDRIAATIRHNRARGKHRIESMSDIVVELKRRNWSHNRISKELGMDADEVLRLLQISGLKDMFKDQEFSEAWEHESALDEAEVNLEWMSQSVLIADNIGWVDRTENHSVLYGQRGQLGSLQKSRFVDNEWFCYAYCGPTRESRQPTKEEAKQWIEDQFNEEDLSPVLEVGGDVHEHVEETGEPESTD